MNQAIVRSILRGELSPEVAANVCGVDPRVIGAWRAQFVRRVESAVRLVAAAGTSSERDRLCRAFGAAGDDPSRFERIGDVWSITFAGSTVYLRDHTGLGHLARLLAAPGQYIAARSFLPGADAAATEPTVPDAARERARVNVTRQLRNAMRRIRAVHPALGEHLLQSVRTGTRCAYVPMGTPPRWSCST